MRTLLSIILLFFSIPLTFSQESPFDIHLIPVSISNLGGIQSYAFGQHKGKWLIVGGRLDGLHRRQPWATFDEAGHNNQLIVIDPKLRQKWSAPLSSLPDKIQEQLSSTNMNFYQDGDRLYCIGGYGYSKSLDDHTTYPYLTAIQIPEVIDAIINNNDYTSYFRQIENDLFQVTGGKLIKIYDTFYLLGGQKFIGRYNPHGPNHGPGFVQEYTNAIRKFVLEDDGQQLVVNRLAGHVDSLHLHRRDYNALPQILPNGNEAITMFSGVFQYDEDVPFLTAVTVDSTTYQIEDNFNQYYNHYHCASIPLYSRSTNEMHNIFFGGIAQYYDSLGMLVKDNDVPFVNTIARVTRGASGQMAEYKLPTVMPSLLGAGAEFIPNRELQFFENGVIDMDEALGDTILLGHIYGGIHSSAPNIFWVNDGTQSTATHQIFEVFATKNKTTSVHELNPESIKPFDFTLYPNPSNNGHFTIDIELEEKEDLSLNIYGLDGSFNRTVSLGGQNGENTFTIETDFQVKGIYYISLISKFHKMTKLLIVE